MLQIVKDYVEARCNARRSYDRYNTVEANKFVIEAGRLYCNRDNSTWNALNHAKEFLSNRPHIRFLSEFELEMEVHEAEKQFA